jgi:hypothetical protein
LEEYWISSKARLDRWGFALKHYKQAASGLSGSRRTGRWQTMRSVVEEILTGEVLTRTWTAVLCAHDRRHRLTQAEPIARSVLIGHIEARHRAMTLMVHGPGVSSEEAVRLNQLRKRAEKWTDLLVGRLVQTADVSQFATNPQRAIEFARDMNHEGEKGTRETAWALTSASLRRAFLQEFSPDAANADLNARIGSAVLACFPAGLFNDSGVFRSLWIARMLAATEDAQGLVAELFAADQGEAYHKAHPREFPGMSRWSR